MKSIDGYNHIGSGRSDVYEPGSSPGMKIGKFGMIRGSCVKFAKSDDASAVAGTVKTCGSGPRAAKGAWPNIRGGEYFNSDRKEPFAGEEYTDKLLILSATSSRCCYCRRVSVWCMISSECCEFMGIVSPRIDSSVV
ncbi:hypothetical protein H6P81_004393 [Aristolochia fimbriata]|uniref:Uncharacterized protein n=1 Tax=Aristolochia fimbriata TaxID=158543 RepID=A0AAV7FF93_ARIFI|nr:hypothetical protein H6P81_004393 [Aristolochia fimbriata]